MTNARQTRRLNELITRCNDDSSTYTSAAAAHGVHREELGKLARRHAGFAGSLAEIVRAAGTSPHDGGSMIGWMRRSLLGFRAIVQGQHHLGDSLHACATQDERTVEGYRDALGHSWSPSIEEVLRSQLDALEIDHARTHQLRGQA